jgi:transaldolase
VNHPAQGLAAAAAGARFIAPYVGRVDDAGRSGLETLTALRRVIDVAGAATLRVLAASLRSADAVAGAAAAGADDLTFSAEVARALLEDATTVAAADEFEQLAAAR